MAHQTHVLVHSHGLNAIHIVMEISQFVEDNTLVVSFLLIDVHQERYAWCSLL